MPSDANPLHDHDFLNAVLDLLIPPDPDRDRPGAGALGLGDAVGGALNADARFGEPVQAGLEAVRDTALERDPAGFAALPPDERLEVFQAQLTQHPALAPGLTHHTYLAYYQHPTVLAALGQPPRPPFPEGYEIEQTDPELLAILESRRLPAPDA